MRETKRKELPDVCVGEIPPFQRNQKMEKNKNKLNIKQRKHDKWSPITDHMKHAWLTQIIVPSYSGEKNNVFKLKSALFFYKDWAKNAGAIIIIVEHFF